MCVCVYIQEFAPIHHCRPCRRRSTAPCTILILRPPHCSHIIQNEDVANFGPFKDRLAIEKSKLIAEQFIKGGINAVRITRADITKITKEPW